MPDENCIVLVFALYNHIYTAICVQIGQDSYQWNVFTPSGTLYYRLKDYSPVTHWMPLPSPPEDEPQELCFIIDNTGKQPRAYICDPASLDDTKPVHVDETTLKGVLTCKNIPTP